MHVSAQQWQEEIRPHSVDEAKLARGDWPIANFPQFIFVFYNPLQEFNRPRSQQQSWDGPLLQRLLLRSAAEVLPMPGHPLVVWGSSSA